MKENEMSAMEKISGTPGDMGITVTYNRARNMYEIKMGNDKKHSTAQFLTGIVEKAIADEAIASCAAGPWQSGVPPKDGEWWLGSYPYLTGGHSVEIVKYDVSLVAKGINERDAYVDKHDNHLGCPDKHAPINLPRG